MEYLDELLNIKKNNYYNKSFFNSDSPDNLYGEPAPNFQYTTDGKIKRLDTHYWRKVHTIYYAKRFNFPKIVFEKQQKQESDLAYLKRLNLLKVSCRFHQNLTRVKVFRYKKRFLNKYFRDKFYNGKLMKKKLPKILPLVYYRLKFFSSFNDSFKISSYEFLFFIKKFFGVFTKNGNKHKIYNIIMSALKHLCLKYNFNLTSTLYFIYFLLKPDAYLKPYYFWKTKFFTGDIITKLSKKVSVPCYWVKTGIKDCKNRTLFLKFVAEFDNILTNNKKYSKILMQKNLYIEKLKEVRIKDRYPYTNLNIGVDENKKTHVL